MERTEIKTWDDIISSNERFQFRVIWSGIPINTFPTHRLYNFVSRPGTESSYRRALEFASRKSGHHFLTFAGETGRGKTHLALGIAWHWLENDIGLVKYYQAESLLDELRSGYKFKENDFEGHYSFNQLLKWLKAVDLLIIDDLGVEYPTEWASSKLDEIIDHRYINGFKTVFATNLSPSSLAARGQKRLASRMTEGFVELLKCDDYRTIKSRLRERLDDDPRED